MPPRPPSTRLKSPKEFEVDLVYSVPKESQGSWINMCVDPQGRFIVSDQFGALYRVTIPPKGSHEQVGVEKLPIEFGSSTGVGLGLRQPVRRRQRRSGKIRERTLPCPRHGRRRQVRFRRVVVRAQWRRHPGRRRARPARRASRPDGKSLYVVCGNNTKYDRVAHSRMPQTLG